MWSAGSAAHGMLKNCHQAGTTPTSTCRLSTEAPSPADWTFNWCFGQMWRRATSRRNCDDSRDTTTGRGSNSHIISVRNRLAVLPNHQESKTNSSNDMTATFLRLQRIRRSILASKYKCHIWKSSPDLRKQRFIERKRHIRRYYRKNNIWSRVILSSIDDFASCSIIW
jgi:hypothetical protein